MQFNKFDKFMYETFKDASLKNQTWEITNFTFVDPGRVVENRALPKYG